MTDKTTKQARVRGILWLTAFIVASAVLCGWAWEPLMRLATQPEGFRAWVQARGIWGGIAFVGMVVLQVVIAIIPGEPFEIAAGYAFGFWMGTALCLLGTTIGGLLVFLLVRRFGRRLVELFFPADKLATLPILCEPKRLKMLTFVLFAIPGTPKDLLTYAVGLTPMRLPTWLWISIVARMPSIVTSTIGGNALGLTNYWQAVVAFAVALVVAGGGALVYRRLSSPAAVKKGVKSP